MLVKSSNDVIIVGLGNAEPSWLDKINASINTAQTAVNTGKKVSNLFSRNKGRNNAGQPTIAVVNQQPSSNNIVAETPTSGTFDWIGGQNNNTQTGFHTRMPNAIKPGDMVQVIEASGRYNGIHEVAYTGADDGTYADTMFVIDKPRIPGLVTQGSWRIVSGADKSVTSSVSKGSSIDTKTIVIGLSLLTAAGVATYFIFK